MDHADQRQGGSSRGPERAALPLSFSEEPWVYVMYTVDNFRRLRALTVGPDGALYMGTSNRDGRFEPGPEDDTFDTRRSREKKRSDHVLPTLFFW